MSSRARCQFAVRAATLNFALNHRPVSKRDTRDAPAIRAGISSLAGYDTLICNRLPCTAQIHWMLCTSSNMQPSPVRQTASIQLARIFNESQMHNAKYKIPKYMTKDFCVRAQSPPLSVLGTNQLLKCSATSTMFSRSDRDDGYAS